MERIHSFDFLKGLALFFVVLIHAKPFIGFEGILHYIGIVLLNLARFAVPSFFLISGYLFSKKLNGKKDSKYTLAYLKKLLKEYGKATAIFLAINLILVVAKDYVSFQGLDQAIIFDVFGFEGVMNFLYFGSAVSYHLWFLPALAFSIAAVYVFQRFDLITYLLPASFIVHLVGVAAGAYNLVPIPAQPRDPLFFGLFFVVTGFYISENNLEKTVEKLTALKLFILFAILHIVEGLFISTGLPIIDAPSLDYSLFTSLMSITLFVFVLSDSEMGKGTRFEKYGRNSLWIYILHPIPLSGLIAVSNVLSGFIGVSVSQSWVWQILLTPVVFFVTAESVLRYRK